MSIEVSGITKLYRQQKALNNISFKIPQGEIVGFLGPNGAGKSTMMKIITGFLPPNSGSVKVCGKQVNEQSLEIRRLIGYLPEHNPLYLDMYVKEYLGFVAGIYKLANTAEKVKEMIDLTGLNREKHKKIGALSKGYRQRVGLAQALISDPKVLILDEPTTGLDPNQIAEVRELIKNLGKEKTILLSTHIMQEVQAICERVIIINNGTIVADDKAHLLASSTFADEQIVTIEFTTDVSIELLKEIKTIKEVKHISASSFQISSSAKTDIRPELFEFAVQKGLVILTMTRDDRSLEDVFHALTEASGG